MPQGVRIGLGEANRLILMASTLNMILPSKMGDLAKAYFMKGQRDLDGSSALSLVVFEKATDMLSLLLWCVIGLLLSPKDTWFFWAMAAGLSVGLVGGLCLLGSRICARNCFAVARALAPAPLRDRLDRLQRSWQALQDYVRSSMTQFLTIGGTSVGIWFLHLLQIWMFILALNAWVPFVANLALAPLAILAGLVPLTFAGVGTRDSALIVLYQPFFNAPTAAALGLLCTSRYLLPAIGGLPFLGRSLAMLGNLRTRPTLVSRLEPDLETQVPAKASS
jgi:uncharacterized protein (TIRG00374 family)